MNTSEVLELLAQNRNPRGVEHWEKLDQPEPALSSFGIGLTVLRKLAKQIGRDHELAQQLWQSEVYDARVLGLLVDEPKKITREQAETQVEQLHYGMLAHVFASCDATLAKTPFAADLAAEWVQSTHEVRRQCGYTLIYELSKSKRKSAPDEAWFLGHVARIRQTQTAEPDGVRLSMATALMGIGKRSAALNGAALEAAREVGAVPGTPGCEPFDATKHLTSDYLRTKLGLG